MKKIVSLLPAATEIVCALGLEEQLAGRSHECDFPESIKRLPVCSSATFTSGSSSIDIDRQVKSILPEALSIYEVNKDLIKELNPDVVITQAQCEVCAVSLSDVEDALSGLLNKQVEIISLQPTMLKTIFMDIRLVAEKLGVPERAEELTEGYTERIELIRHKLKHVKTRPKVACIEWLDPLMTAGNWTPELVEIAGGISLLSENGKHSPWISWDDLARENPEVMIIAPCGFSIPRTLSEIHLLTSNPYWQTMQAVQNNRVYIADGNHYFNRSGPRIVDTIEMIAEMIAAGQFHYGFEGESWVSLQS